MKNSNIMLLVILVIVISAIFFLESNKTKTIVLEPEVLIQNFSDKEFQWINPDAKNYKVVLNPAYKIAPDLQGIAGWINSEPFSLDYLRGKVVIIDFWTYSCINCIRTLPYLVEWDKKYRDKGLVIIGVHSPEFFFEKDINNVNDAVKRYGIEYPVVQDNDFQTWRAYQNRYWPRKYLVDGNGQIRYDHIGEGGYEETEKQIQLLLSELGQDVSDTEVTKENIVERNKLTPELYAGYEFNIPRGQNIGNTWGLKKDQVVDYVLPQFVYKDIIYLEGKWKSNPDNFIGYKNSSIILKYTASSVNIVADSTNTSKMMVYLDNLTLPEIFAGDDVVFEDGEAVVYVSEPRLYNVINGDYGNQELRLTVSDGFSFNAFTFG